MSSPWFKAASFICPHCHALAAQEWVDILRFAGGKTIPLCDPMYISYVSGRPVTPHWTASKCFACQKHAIWWEQRLVYPDPTQSADEATQPHEDMPAEAVALYSEAVAVLPHSKRAAAALCRASLERLLKVLDPEVPATLKLDQRLVTIQGSVSSTTMELLNVLRHVGNTALHGEKDGDGSAVIYLDDNDQTIAETFFLAINVLVDELITRPKRSKELYDALPDGVRESFERKAADASRPD